MTRQIRLTRGMFALVDDDDYEVLSKFNWHIQISGKIFYAVRHPQKRYGESGMKVMHRVILDAPDNMSVDHIDGNGLNNTRANLRLCTHQENCYNRQMGTNNTSGFKGVAWHKLSGKWQARIGVNGKRRHLGYFTTAEEASDAYEKAAREFHGNFARCDAPDICERLLALRREIADQGELGATVAGILHVTVDAITSDAFDQRRAYADICEMLGKLAQAEKVAA